MAYGLNIVADNGNIAFSTDYACYRFYAKVTLIPNQTQPGNSNIRYAQTTVTSNYPPIVFVSPTSGTFVMDGVTYNDSVSITSMTVSGNVWTINYASYVAVTDPTLTTSITAYIFVADHSAATGYGMNIFNASGTCIYSTSTRSLKINAYHITSQAAQNSVYTFTPTGTIPTSHAVCCSNIGVMVVPSSPTAGQWLPLGVSKINSSQMCLIASSRIGQSGLPAYKYNINGTSYIMIIDSSLYD